MIDAKRCFLLKTGHIISIEQKQMKRIEERKNGISFEKGILNNDIM